jgi:chromosome segregation ATPase
VTINAELAEERKANAAAKKQLTVSKKALATEKANVNTLHENLSQTQETLENLNQHTLSLSKELNAAKHKIASLESEMASLLHSLDEERNKSAALQLGASQMDAIMKEKELACGKVEQLEKELVNTRAESKILKKNPTERRRIVKASPETPFLPSCSETCTLVQ